MKACFITFLVALIAMFTNQGNPSPDVEGVDIYQKMTKAQVVAKFGAVTSYQTYTGELGKVELFDYGKKQN